jgi:putative membrane protein
MSEKPYSEYIKDHKSMILRDYLAIDRTILTNEPAFMAYVRTSLALLAAGVSLVKFFNDPFMHILGWGFVGAGSLVAMYGYGRYRQVDNLMHQVKGDYIAEQAKTHKKRKGVTDWTIHLFRRN